MPQPFENCVPARPFVLAATDAVLLLSPAAPAVVVAVVPAPCGPAAPPPPPPMVAPLAQPLPPEKTVSPVLLVLRPPAPAVDVVAPRPKSASTSVPNAVFAALFAAPTVTATGNTGDWLALLANAPAPPPAPPRAVVARAPPAPPLPTALIVLAAVFHVPGSGNVLAPGRRKTCAMAQP